LEPLAAFDGDVVGSLRDALEREDARRSAVTFCTIGVPEGCGRNSKRNTVPAQTWLCRLTLPWITPCALIANVSRVVASKAGEGAAFVTFDGHRSDDYGIYIFATNDYGESWKAIRNGIPDSAGSVHVIREHPRNQNLLFAGLEFGLWVSWDRGANWTALKNNFPTVR